MTPAAPPKELARFAGVIPCSGASRRMGRAKALLSLGGDTFVGRAVRALVEGGCAPVYVVIPTDPSDAELSVEQVARIGDAVRRAGGRILRNPDPGDGPSTSLRIALGEVDDQVAGVAYLPLDHPRLEPRTVEELLRSARTTGADLTLPMHGSKRGHPAVFGRALFEELLDPRLEGGARTVVHRHLDDACLLPTDDAGTVTDVDTPEAYRAAVAATTPPVP